MTAVDGRPGVEDQPADDRDGGYDRWGAVAEGCGAVADGWGLAEPRTAPVDETAAESRASDASGLPVSPEAGKSLVAVRLVIQLFVTAIA